LLVEIPMDDGKTAIGARKDKRMARAMLEAAND
jgi:hypothetical protein